MTYSELKASIANYVHREDLTDMIPTFISMAEGYLFREISPPETESVVTGATVAGYAVLPSDFGTLAKLTVNYNGATRNVEYLALASYSDSADATPGYYTFEAGKLRIYGTSTGQAYTLHYIPSMAPLSDSAPSNWLLNKAPDLYLHAGCLEASKYTLDAAEQSRLEPIVTALVDSVRRYAERKGVPASGPMRITPRSVV